MYEYDFCYHEPEEVVEIDDVTYFCADKNGVFDFVGDAVINLTGRANIPDIGIKELQSHVDSSYKELVVAWPDFGIPKVKPSFWPALHLYIKSQKWKRVCIHCEGGHGRTGTAMAAIIITTLSWTVQEAIEYIRTMFCEKMVETPDQLEYLCKLYETVIKKKVDRKTLPVPSVVIAHRKYQAENESKMMNKVGLMYDTQEEAEETEKG